MRLSFLSRCLVAATVLVVPAVSHADAAADIVMIFGRDPGMGAAHACFLRRYSKAHLASHPQQNVTDMLLYVSKQEGSEPYYGLSLQVNFRQLSKPFQVAGSCSIESGGKSALGCGIDCDGGHLGVRVKDARSLLVEIPNSVRIFDPADMEGEADADLPQGARFGADDKLFRTDRTDLRDCLPLIYDEAIKASVMQGETSQ